MTGSKPISGLFLHPEHIKRNLVSVRVLHTSAPTHNQPWYLRPEESPKVSSPLKQIVIPTLPTDSPENLKEIVNLLATKLGIDDIQVFDLRDNADANEGAVDLATYMVIGTGKSIKHLQKASEQLDYYVKHTLHELPITEGLESSNDAAKFRRRLRRKGKGAPQYAKFDYGASPNTWVMTDCKLDGIYVHMLTEQRRHDLNLEHLWAKDKSPYERRPQSNHTDDIFAGLRYFHTERTLRTVQTFDQLKTQHLQEPSQMPLVRIQDHFDAIQANGKPLGATELYQYIDLLLQSQEFHNGLTRDIDVYEKRFHYINYILKRYAPDMSKETVKRILPLLVLAGSQCGNDKFVTLDKIQSMPRNDFGAYPEIFTYSPIIHKFYQISLSLTGHNIDDGFQKEIDLLCLTVYANRHNWMYAKKIVDNALKRQDIDVVKAYLRLLAVKGDGPSSYEFVNSYYPLLALARDFDLAEESRYVQAILERCDPDGTQHLNIRHMLDPVQ